MSLLAPGTLPPRTYEVGRIRSGDKDADGKPRRLEGFRFTTYTEAAAYQVAELFEGDEPRPWRREWEVYTRCRSIAVALPPGALVVSQAMMRWTGGGPTVVCNGRRTSKPGIGPCQCPQPDDPSDEESVWAAVNERRRLANLKNPAGCKAHTWIKVALPDIDGFGVWTLHSTSENAASEIIGQAVLLERARDAGQFLPAAVDLRYKESRVDGLLRQYNVPILRVDKSIRALGAAMVGGARVADQLPPAPGEQRRAIAATPAPRGAFVPGEVIEPEIADGEIVNEWLDAALASAAALPDEESGRALWRESASKAHAGEITGADAARVQGLITARLADLRSDMAPLDPEDPWSLKVEGLDTEADAGDALGELDVLRAKGAVDPSHAARIRAAVLLRFPQAAAS